MKNYKITDKQAISRPFTIKKIEILSFAHEIGSTPIAKPTPTLQNNPVKTPSKSVQSILLPNTTPEPKEQNNELLLLVAIFIILLMLWLLNLPRLQAYNDCYQQNMQKWGSCQELGHNLLIK